MPLIVQFELSRTRAGYSRQGICHGPMPRSLWPGAQRDSMVPSKYSMIAEHGPIIPQAWHTRRIGQIDGRGARNDGAPHWLAQEIDVVRLASLSGNSTSATARERSARWPRWLPAPPHA